ncbi:cobalamin-dependent protein [Bradyrhizobium tropiciagri]|uniref:cobalamin B12-binding domain-containing protein n=1 Tax=Bradyrhizobium tropiciagri TaxID=312253 RepID=UPI001BA8B54C|nr:B12-binding domain-containing protein [Bradyrhizobium tropiciagri]MBR0871037.1 cobalamin-dependent protein [Bradyrhizobium tropiciagri]
MQEIAPYDDFSISHGLCTSCDASLKDPFANHEIERSLFLSGVFHRLFDAGRHEDFNTAARIVERAIAANCRPVDILIGMLSPMLYEIGEEWKRGALSVEAEHRFTAFSERVVRLVESRIGAAAAPSSRPGTTLLFLMNAPGNRHRLAVRILALWLKGRGARVRIVDGDLDHARLLHSIAAERPDYLLISMAVIEQRDRVVEICGAAQALPQDVRPKIVVGGYPVKAGLIESIPGAELLSDITVLQIA